jgi:hypothetical protein
MLDFKVPSAGDLAIGPFVTLSLAQFDHESGTASGTPAVTGQYLSTTVSQDISNQTLHEWFMFGIRGIYDIRF